MTKSLEKIRKESIELCDKVLEGWKTFKEKGLGDYQKFELENSELVSSWKNKQKEEEDLKKIWSEESAEEFAEKEEKGLELAKNEFWITTPNYNSLNWGSKKVKLDWVDEDGWENGEQLQISDKVVKLGNDWFKMVKLNSLPNWLEREREEIATFLYLPTKKSQEQVALIQFKKIGSWEVVAELKIAPKWTNSSKIRWLLVNEKN